MFCAFLIGQATAPHSIYTAGTIGDFYGLNKDSKGKVSFNIIHQYFSLTLNHF